MVKFTLILVVLVAGYFNIKSVLANSEEAFREDELLLPANIEDYQNDENVEGSGFSKPEIEDTDKAPPDVAQDATSKEVDQAYNDEQEETVDIPEIAEEENQSVAPPEPDESNDNEEQTAEKDSQQVDEVGVPPVDEENISEPDEKEASEVKEDTNVSQVENEENTLTVDDSSNTNMNNSQSEDEPENAVNNTNESQENASEDHSANKDNDNIDIQDKSGNTSLAGGELEPAEETVQKNNDSKTDKDQEEHTSNIVVTGTFEGEKDLPAERFAKSRGLGKSMPLQEGEPNHEDVPEMEQSFSEVKADPEEENVDVHEHHKESQDMPDINRGLEKGNVEEPKEIEDPGASSASSSSNTITFVIILGLIALVGIVGYFVHKKRRNHQRATPVPTHEDRELKEVKTHKPGDDGGLHEIAQKQAHIPEVNPLIINYNKKNGHLQSEHQQQLLTTLLPAKPKDDDILMMDDDAEDERAERRPLVMGTFKPMYQTGEPEKNEEQKQIDETNAVAVTRVGGD